MSTTHENDHRFDVAAYALRALSAGENAFIEEHLATCAECTGELQDHRWTVALLGSVSLDDLDEPDAGAVPDTLLPSLLRTVRRDRTRRRWYVGAAAGIAAAAVIVAGVLAVHPRHDASPAPVAAGRPLTALVSSSVQADATLRSVSWGTEITLNCRYDSIYQADLPYSLIVRDKSGQAHPGGSWTLVPGKVVHFTGGTSLPTNQISSVEIDAGSTPILRLTV